MTAAGANAGTPADADVELRGIDKNYGDVTALTKLDLCIRKGEFLSLLGPSGCGKTTTLRIIAGLETPDGGSVSVGAIDIGSIPTYRRNLGMVFQSFALFPQMTVAENIAFGLRMRNIAKTEIRHRVEHAIDLVNLVGKADRLPKQLSGGQQQRVALARAIVTNPSVLLLDEPLSALDRKLREEMQLEMRQLQRKLGLTTILVTHDQQEAMTLSDRIAIMNEGRLVQLGKPREVYDRPTDGFVATFMGTANRFSVTLEHERLAVDDSGTRFELADAVPARPGSRLELAIRPEKIKLRKNTTDSPHLNSVQVEIAEIVFTGINSIIHCKLPDNSRLIVIQNNDDDENIFDIGERIWARWSINANIIINVLEKQKERSDE